MGSTVLKKSKLNKNRESKLTDKERRFIAEYQVDYNGTRACIAAGYSAKTAGVMASKLLAKDHIARAIGNSQRLMVKKLELTAEEVLLQLYYCVTRSAKDFCDSEGKIITDVHLLSERACATIDSIKQDSYYDNDGIFHTKTELRLVPKAHAIDMAMKHKGLFAPTKVNSTVSLDWDSLVGEPDPMPDIVEQKLLEQEKAACSG